MIDVGLKIIKWIYQNDNKVQESIQIFNHVHVLTLYGFGLTVTTSKVNFCCLTMITAKYRI